MDSMKIEDYKYQLIGLCENCNARARCKDFNKICFRKKIAFAYAKIEYKRRLKKGEIK